MKFTKQKYQLDCVNNILEVFKDYDNQANNKEQFLNHYKKVQEKKDFPIKNTVEKLQLDVLMETGTGKTFTYLNTIFELHKQHKLKKFIIIVPRKAIRQGVIQNIQLTESYFYHEYKQRITIYTYDGKQSLANIKSHYLKNLDELSVLVLTNSSFDKDTNILNQQTETLFESGSTIKAIQKLRPIIFIDEPHLLKGEKFQKNFKNFDSICLRFGATFPKEENYKLANMIYSLDSISSFRQNLVKKICVSTIINNQDDIKFAKVSGQGKNKEVKVYYFENNQEKSTSIKLNDDIGLKINNDNWKGISCIKANQKKVFLSNGKEIELDKNYQLSEEEIRLMIAKTIDFHFEKEESLFNQGIKCLSLFFIPSIQDFRGENPRIKNIFEEEYRKKRAEILQKVQNDEYKKFLERDFDNEGKLKVHEGYFSGDKGTGEDKEIEGINLILNKKEELLSFNTPLRFIFSVWALQEGWDNPNIFSLCKLSSTKKEISRRQQVGRGLRIAVNQKGSRQSLDYLGNDERNFYNINSLDLVVSGQEKNFIEEIQKEIQDNSYSIFGDYLTLDTLKEKGLNDREAINLLPLLKDAKIISWEEEAEKYLIKGSIREYLETHKEELNFLTEERLKGILKIFSDEPKNPVEDRNKSTYKVKIRQKKP